MATQKGATETSTANELVITRVFDAPRGRVFEAWTDPDQVVHWWGPASFTAPFARSDFRVGGKYLYCMRSQEGKDYWSTGVYREIVRPERIVCTDSFADENGNVVPASYYDMEGDFPLEMVMDVTFEDHDGKTRLILRHIGMPAGEMQEMAGQGWNESLDKLADYLAQDDEV